MQSTRDYTGNEETTQSGLHFWGQVYGGSDRREDVRTATVFGQTTNFDLGSRQNLSLIHI